MKSICILGRQPAIGVVELESLYGSESITPITTGVVGLDKAAADIAFSRLGGSLKLARYLTTIDSQDWDTIENFLKTVVIEHEKYVPEGKLTLGISTYGIKINPKSINRTTLELKKVIRAKTTRSVRVVPNKSTQLSSAQVIHNKLTTENGWELVLVRHGKQTVLGLTTNIQDIEAYAARDQARPKRDARVGMLPPKLAQTIINLAGTHTVSSTGLPPTPEQIKNSRTKAAITILLDPFCGTGVVLQEALLVGYEAYGTDLDERMIEFSRINLEWLANSKQLAGSFTLEQGDATSHKWKEFHVIACETYLGRPFSHEPDQSTLQKVMQDVDTIHKKFLENVARQAPPGFRMCIAVPAWNIKGRFRHLKTLDSLEELGYTRVSFAHAGNEELIYHREGQIVGRELVVLTRV